MIQCPNGHEVGDNVKFCPTCGAEIVSGNKFCTKCGSERMGTEKFCSKCGTPFDNVTRHEQISYEEEQPKSGFKKYLPYILGAFVLLAIIGYFGSKDSSVKNEDSMAIDSISADSVVTNEVTPISKEKLESILTQLIGDMDADLALKKANKLFTEEFKTYYNRACEKADREGLERPRLWWQFSDSDPETFVVEKIEMTDNGNAKALVKLSSELYEGRFEVLLNSESGDWLIDKITEQGVENVQTYEANEGAEYENVSNKNYSTSSRTFYDEQIVVGYLANQTFRSSDGFTIRFDGSGRMYAEGDFAGVVSVLRYNSTSALLRYGGGQYTEGRFRVDIVGDKFQLTDPVDGTVYYQR